MISIADIKQFFKGEILVNEPLNKHTSIKIGGPADLLLLPSDKGDAINLSVYLQQNGIDYSVIGNGSNILVSDAGIREIVINFEQGLKQIKLVDGLVEVESGVMLARFVDFCIQNGKQGVEKLAGIPGTIGGAIVMNASAYKYEISDYIVDVEVVRNGKLIRVKKQDANFAYRTSAFLNDIIISAVFELPDGNIDEMQKTRIEYLQKRNLTQPLNYPNSGSVFKNPPGNYAAKLIEDADLKGLRIGNAQISEKHANFIVNLGNAKAEDVLGLIQTCKEIVEQKFDVYLELELKLLGFGKSE
ncbi:MAG: UDP-N-acetylmuramate dehydrogenase [Bacteroidetes bacterium]|nr:UDP-N-acetylmuramate dehydrogenase [Bacteroidota bacterium]MBU1421839.1 UDP-N-acetylmuramate dehydrogenase [Bacteroidota bacterium]MBU2636745.1 UDP-N-acetylmuramate dehydrogenase [Bacteroidota bacterium]